VPTDDERANCRFWDVDADDYQGLHGPTLAAAPMAWGPFRHPESDLGVLGDVAGRDVLEYGCGAAQWSMALRELGAHVVGLDISRSQLTHARRNDARVTLVAAAATEAPFARASFDIVFCDHGATSFCDPALTVPEVARLLRPGGRFAFSISAPLLWWTYDERRDRQTDRLRNPAFGRRRWHVEGGTVDYCILAGEWLRLFARHGLIPVDCIELPVPAGASTTYGDYIDADLAASWPFEQIWIATRAPVTPVSS